MGKVSDAMRKHQAEEAEQAGRTAGPEPSVAASALTAGSPVTAGPLSAGKSPLARGSSNGYSSAIVAHHDRGGSLAEEYRSLRTSLLAQTQDQRLCLLVTSALQNEGKTVTCLNLGVILAEHQDRRTIIVDCDLRKHQVAGLLRMNNKPGMADLLRGNVRLKEIIHPTAYPNLFVVPGGSADSHEVGELITRAELEETFAELRRGYDHVLVDTPPVNVVSETGMIGQAVGSSLMVVRMHKTHKESVERAIRLLHAANVQVAGIVLTHRRYLIPQYLYRYS